MQPAKIVKIVGTKDLAKPKASIDKDACLALVM
jgi:hypothetical protein